MKLIYKLWEMAFDRETLIRKVSNQDAALAEHIISILIFNQYSDWDQTIADILNKLSILYRIKSKRLSKSKTMELLFSDPIEETDFSLWIKSLSKMKNLSAVRTNITEEELYSIYTSLLNFTCYGEAITRGEVREIIKLRQL